jgi:drug/metabolite transporter (DMT)-like permease
MSLVWAYLSILEVFITSASLIVTKYLTQSSIDAKLLISLTYIIVGFNALIFILSNREKNFKAISANISIFIIALILISAFLRTFGSVIVAEALKKAPNIGLCHLIINTNVVFTLLASYFLFNQKINGKTFIGVLITLLGISTVIYYSQ